MPSSRRHDVIVAGLGAMGSSAAYQLARRGRRVLGLDRFDPPHAMGSTHGHSRIIRTAYWDDPSYVPLVGRAHESWRELEAASGERLYFPTGQLYLGAHDSMLVSGARDSVRLNGIPYEELSGAALAQRAPGLRTTAALSPSGSRTRVYSFPNWRSPLFSSLRAIRGRHSHRGAADSLGRGRRWRLGHDTARHVPRRPSGTDAWCVDIQARPGPRPAAQSRAAGDALVPPETRISGNGTRTDRVFHVGVRAGSYLVRRARHG